LPLRVKGVPEKRRASAKNKSDRRVFSRRAALAGHAGKNGGAASFLFAIRLYYRV
jgi:hypothetical protein